MHGYRFDRLLRPLARGMAVAGLAAVAAVMIAGCGAGGSLAPSSPLGNIDTATRTVQLNLFIGGNGFNGFSSGRMMVRVPEGWKVDVLCSNQASRPRSCAVVSGATSKSPAFSGAATAHPFAGVPTGKFANFSFIAGRVGSFRLTSLAPRPEDRTRWEHFDVVAGGIPSASVLRGRADQLVMRLDRRNS